MTKQDLLELIDAFYKETWKYEANDNLDKDMDYISNIEKELNTKEDIDIIPIYERLKSLIEIIKLKYGTENKIINNNPDLREELNNVSLDNIEIINQIIEKYNTYINEIINNKEINFINNNYKDVSGKEGLYLAVESLKSFITEDKYRELLDDIDLKEVLIDCISLNENENKIIKIEKKYKETIDKIWNNSLSNNVDENGNFRVLYSNIQDGEDIRTRANALLNRNEQHSCSMISSTFIATYASSTRRIGFIYPNDTEIDMVSAYDLYSNVNGTGSKNKEKGSYIATPDVLEKIGIERTKSNNQDVYSSSCYNEVLVGGNSKPCGIMFIGLGEKDINIDYNDVQLLASSMNLPITYIDTMDYTKELSDYDKHYIAYHAISSYLGVIRSNEINEQINIVENMIKTHQDQIVDIFLNLKKSGNLNKENMNSMLSTIINKKEVEAETIINKMEQGIDVFGENTNTNEPINKQMGFIKMGILGLISTLISIGIIILAVGLNR